MAKGNRDGHDAEQRTTRDDAHTVRERQGPSVGWMAGRAMTDVWKVPETMETRGGGTTTRGNNRKRGRGTMRHKGVGGTNREGNDGHHDHHLNP